MRVTFSQVNVTHAMSIFLALLMLLAENLWQVELLGKRATALQLYSKIAIFLCLLFLIYQTLRSNIVLRSSGYGKLIVFFYCTLAFTYLKSAVGQYDQPIASIINCFFYFSGLFVYFALCSIKNIERRRSYCFKAILGTGLLALAFCVVCSFLGLSWIFSESSINNDPEVRLLFTRVAGFADNQILFLLAFLFSSLLYSTRKNFYKELVFFALGFFVLCFIVSSRQLIFSFLVAVVLYLLYRSVSSHRARFSGMVLLVFVAALSPFVLQSVIDLLASFYQFTANPNDITSQSTLSRYLALDYFSQYFADTSYLGFGWMPVTDDLSANFVANALHTKNFRLVDLGLFSTLFQYGPFGLLCIFSFYYISFGFARNAPNIEKACITIFLLVKIISFSYLFTWASHAVFFGVFMAYLSSYNDRSRRV